MVTVLVDSLVREPPMPIISSDPLSIVSVPVVSVNETSSVTVAAPSMIMVSEPVGSVSSLQFVGLDQRPSPASPSQIPFGSRGSILKSSKKNVDPP